MTYKRRLFGVGSIIIGAFFLIEHILVWDEVSFWDFIGHEWLGFILIIFGIALNINFMSDRLSKELVWIYNKIWKKKQ